MMVMMILVMMVVMVVVMMVMMMILVMVVVMVLMVVMVVVMMILVVMMVGDDSNDGGDGEIMGTMMVAVVTVTSRPRLPPSPGLVREQEAGLLQFLRLDGFSVLMRAMQQQVQKLKVKSAFLLQNLLVGHPEHKGGVARAGSWDGSWRGVHGGRDCPSDPVALPQGPCAPWAWSSSWWPSSEQNTVPSMSMCLEPCAGALGPKRTAPLRGG